MKFRNSFAKYLICVAVLMSFVLICPAEDMVFASAPNTVQVAQATEMQITRAEQTEWRFRTVDGKGQKRLWSLTYGKWLTEWEWVV